MEVVTENPVTKDIPEGYKHTEVGLIPEDWDVVKVESAIKEIAMGPFGSNIKVSNFTNSGIPVLNGSNVQKEKLIDNFDNYVTEEKAKSLNKAVAKRGDIIITHRGTLGQVSYIPDNSEYKNYVISQSQFRVKFKPSLATPHWIVLYLLSEKGSNKLMEGKGHTGVPAIAQPTTTFRKLSVPLPSIEEQQAIAESLSDVDALIAKLDALIEKKQQIKKGAMQQLLTGKTRLPGFDGEWEEKKLGEVAHVQRGASPRPISSPKWFSLKKDVGWVRISDISDSDGKNLLKTADYLSKAGIERSRFLPKGSLILSIAATVGLPVITRIDTCIHDGFVGLTNLEVDQEFLYYKLKELENDLVEMGQTGSQNNINSTIVRNVQTLFPPLEEQKAIARILSDMDTEIEALQSKRSKYKQIKQGMMQELLTGKTRLV